ncbi:AMP-binding protein [Oceanibacterium hippocampi]|uniref:3-methylmercaptopropionyl-CoA ligase n=1 Tax=Oceanibacterium hippocampi TaxID=745714 RepID=A0A1Y5TFN5_9PROT|nr:AMP-binding protein [Oceanibacterium hippocampi]SLN60801.1 Long-chain-fatty-acid--CoA ligase [Oceanibacterium hippocampi]
MSKLSEPRGGRLSVSLRDAARGGAPVAGACIRPLDGKSYVSGDRSEPLRRETIPEMMAATVARFGPRDAAVFSATGERLSYYDLDREVDDLAAGLLALGLEKGDRIGIWSPNRKEWLLTQFATAQIGLVLVNINPAYRLSELEYVLNKVGCKALVTADRFKTSDYVGMVQTLAPELADCKPGKLRAAKLPALRIVVRMGSEPTPGMLAFGDLMRLGGPAQKLRLPGISAALDPDEPINIQFTSGTTGSPKGATLTHYNIVNNAHFVTRAIGFTEVDRLAIPVPLYHCFGMVMGTLGCVSKGAAMIFPGEGFEPGPTLAAIEAERCTGLYGVPTMFVAMLDHPDFRKFQLGSLRTGIMAGSPCPVEVMKRVVADMHMSEVTIAYGMTETSPVSFQSDVDDPLEKRVATVGRIHPHVEVKIVDGEGQVVPVGEQGELCTRGYSVMRGYYNDAERTAEAIDAGGWMHTGDLATLDAEGYCNIVGRVKDMVIRGGENIYPREVEEFLYRHPKVQQAQVFGVPSERYGEELCAWIVLQPGQTSSEEEIRDFCQGQIAHYKVPRYVRFRDELPMTVTGKAQKFLMRDAMIEELGLKAIETA